MKSLVLCGTIALLGFTVVAGAATPEAQLIAPIGLFGDSLNKGDMKTAGSTLSSSGVTIIDEISPYVWAGPDAFDTWLAALTAWEQAEAISDDVFKMGKPTSVVVSGDRGYVTLPVFYTFKQKGVAMREAAHMVYVLQKDKSAWLITAFTWVAATPKPVVSTAQ
jgi:hypothetical protein